MDEHWTHRRALKPSILLTVLAMLAAGMGLTRADTTDYPLVTVGAAPDRIVVIKSERKLHLMQDDEVLRSMDISLGLVPTGAKLQEGDFRTPEGRYYIEAKNSDSDYFLSLKISYPNAADRARAHGLGVDPGGQIMIHGLPNEPKFQESSYFGWDWTDGCIAVSNSDMVDLWLMTAVSMPIEILP